MVTIESRQTTGLVDPESISNRVWPQRGGLAVHWGGETEGIMPEHPHDKCRAHLRVWQRYHMGVHGWVDLAYNWVVCPHGVVMVGRGWAVRSAANGSNDGNDRYLACCYMGGTGDANPTQFALDGIKWVIQEIRRRGAGTDVQPHRHFFSTDCPGDFLAGLCTAWRTLSPTPGGSGSVTSPPFPLPAGWYFGPADGPRESVSGYHGHRSDLAVWQVKVGLTGDGLYGPLTKAAALRIQRAVGLTLDGLIGVRTWAAAWQ